MKIKLTHDNGSVGFIQKNPRNPVFGHERRVFTMRKASMWMHKNAAAYRTMGWTAEIV